MKHFAVGYFIIFSLALNAQTAAKTAGQLLQNAATYNFSTCPDAQHAIMRSVLYAPATESELLKWAKSKTYPKATTNPEVIRVQVHVDGDHVFCAQALDGPNSKQKAAVESAMRWQFKPNRGEFKNYVMGTLTFQF